MSEKHNEKEEGNTLAGNKASNHDSKEEYSFIHEQVVSKRKFRLRRMAYSLGWTIFLACVFGFVAGIVLYRSQPFIQEFLGETDQKKKLDYQATTSEQDKDTENSETSEDDDRTEPKEDNSSVDETTDSEGDNEETVTVTETVIIENTIKGNLSDLSNIYSELRSISTGINKSIVKITSISNSVDVFKNEYETIKTTNGFVLFNNGEELLILVNLDQIQDAKDIRVVLSDTLDLEGILQSYDKELNLAVLAVAIDVIPDQILNYIEPITLGESYVLVVGTPVLALGSPNGYLNSMELGIVTSKGTCVYLTDDVIDTFTTDVNYNSKGNGIIVNLKGEVVGIITQTLMDESNAEVNTVIGISRIKKTIQQLVNNTDRVYMGVKCMDITTEVLESKELTNGIYITEVAADSPALEAGLQSGDIVVAFNDTPIASVNLFSTLLYSCEPKSTVKLTIKRNSKDIFRDMELYVELGKKNE